MKYWLLVGKRSILLLISLFLIHFSGIAQSNSNPYRIKTVVIDPGHGGKDPGNLGTGRYKMKEKDIALDVALRVGGYIEEQFPEIKVIYTRKTDEFIGLNERADIANKSKANLFISIHCNAFSKVTSNGVETFVLGLHRTEENLQVAQTENSAIFLEDDYKTKYEGFDPNSAESIIALTIMQSAFLQQSLTLSSAIQTQFRDRVGRKDRGVKQAGFLVLRRTTMPSVLVELGFLTNAAEEDFLNSENGKSFMSSAIFRGFKEYKDMVEDPIPDGSGPSKTEVGTEVKTPATSEAEVKEQEAKAAQAAAELKAKNEAVEKAKNDAILKAKADSLEQVKKNLEAEKQKREAELAQKEAAKKTKLKAQADSLEQVKQQLILAKEKREAELLAKAQDEQKVKQEAERSAAEKQAQEEKIRKEEELRKQEEAAKAKAQATEILEDIKQEKERELADAKKQAAIEAEKERLMEIKRQKELELAEAKLKAEERGLAKTTDSLELAKKEQEKAKMHAVVQARLDSVAKVKSEQLTLEKSRQDSIVKVKAEETRRNQAAAKAKQQAEEAAKKAEAERNAIVINNKKAMTPEEAEILFLQQRKRELEQRIAQMKGTPGAVGIPKTSTEIKKEQTPTATPRNDRSAKTGIELCVQILTSPTAIQPGSPVFKGVTTKQYQQDGLYKYTAGSSNDFEEITKLQGELRNLGFQGAFVVAFKDGERIKVADARELLKK